MQSNSYVIPRSATNLNIIIWSHLKQWEIETRISVHISVMSVKGTTEDARKSTVIRQLKVICKVKLSKL